MKYIVTSLTFLLTFAWSVGSFAQNPIPDVLPQSSPAETLQLLRVYVPVQEESAAFVVGYAREDADSPWHIELPQMPAMVGRNGVAPQGEKKEKDGRSPQAEFGVGYVFGVNADPPEGLKLPYRQATTTDFWIDEGEDPRYNHWFSGEEPEASHENLILADQRYDLCLTSLYNVNPTTLAKGSAIFLHIWKDPTHPSSGCIALSRESVMTILRWLDPKKTPHIRIEVGSPEN